MSNKEIKKDSKKENENLKLKEEFGGLKVHNIDEEYIQVFALKIEYLEEGGPVPPAA